MPLDSLAQGHGGLDEFRITAPAQIRSMLHALLDGVGAARDQRTGRCHRRRHAVDDRRRARRDQPERQRRRSAPAADRAGGRGDRRRLPRQRQAAVRRPRSDAGPWRSPVGAELRLPVADVPLPAPQQLPGAPGAAQRAGGAAAPPGRRPDRTRAAHPRRQPRWLCAAAARRRAAASSRDRCCATWCSTSMPIPASAPRCSCTT